MRPVPDCSAIFSTRKASKIKPSRSEAERGRSGFTPKKKWRQEQKADEAAKKRFHDRSKLFSLGRLGVGYLTGVLIALSVATALFSSFGDNTKPILWMFISKFDVEGGP